MLDSALRMLVLQRLEAAKLKSDAYSISRLEKVLAQLDELEREERESIADE